uniref:Uncharacterized protein n=1 Tax=Hucho hucho TaxID=62062 RepID=A0A4W5N1F4_9TELE
ILRATEMYSNACLWLFRICSPLSCLHTLFACSSAARRLGLATIARDIRSHSQAKSTPKFKTRTRSTANNASGLNVCSVYSCHIFSDMVVQILIKFGRGGNQTDSSALLSYQRQCVTANKS